MPRAAAGEQRRFGEKGFYDIRLHVERVRPEAVDVRAHPGDVLAQVVLGDEFEREMVLEDFDVGVLRDSGQKRPLHLAPGRIGGVDDAVVRVAALTPEVQRAVFLGKSGPHRHQLAHPLRPLAHHNLDGLAVTQPGSGNQGVLDVLLGGVLGGHHRRDAALRVVRVRLDRLFLRDDGDAAMLGHAKRVGKPRHAATDNEKIELERHIHVQR